MRCIFSFIISVATVLPTIAWANPAPAMTPPTVYEKSIKDFEKAARQENVAGGAVWLIKNGDILDKTMFGLADVERNQAVDEDSIFHWASITKTFTAIALMQLVERDLVSLNDSVVEYIPEFGSAHNPFGSIEDVTVGHLLAHSSGLREGTWPWNADGASARPDWQRLEPPGWDQLAAMFPYTGVKFKPGSTYSYSNPGSTLMGEVVERVTNDDIEVYIDKNILKPLGMTRTYFDITPWHLQNDRSNSYSFENSALKPLGKEFDTGVTTGNGGLNAPVGDMVKYLNFLTGSGDRAVYDAILKRKTLEAMWIPEFETGYDPRVKEQMAKTFFVIDIGQGAELERYIGHTGSQQGFRSFIYIHPESKAAVIMAVNSTNDNPRPLLYDFRLDLLTKVFPALAEKR